MPKRIVGSSPGVTAAAGASGGAPATGGKRWEERLRDVILAGGAVLGVGGCDPGILATPTINFCCNANPDPCCAYLNCGGALTPECTQEMACQAEGGTWEASSSRACSFSQDGGNIATFSESGAPIDPDYEPILDDMTMPRSSTGGLWYTYSDRTVLNSEPPVVAAPPPAGFVAPAEGQLFLPDPNLNGPFINDRSWPVRMADGGGEDLWGAGFGLDIQDLTPDGGQVAINECEAGTVFDVRPDGGSLGIPQPFDASVYTGVGFYANAPSGPVNVEIHVDDVKTSPWGGMYNPCRDDGTCDTAGDAGLAGCPCSDNYVQKFSIAAGWQHYEVHWRSMAIQNWSRSKTYFPGDGGIDPTKIYNLLWQFTTSAGAPLRPFSLQVAYLTWLSD